MSRRMVVGYYAHHHGRGHITRAEAILAALDVDATMLTSAPYRGPHRCLGLPLDTCPGRESVEPQAHGALHWAPLRHVGLRERMALIARWIADARPDVMVVDVSVEVALLARLHGVPTVVMAMPGERTDLPHQLGYRAADAIIASWPQCAGMPEWLDEHADRVHFVGGISRFEARPRESPVIPRRVVVLGGQGGGGASVEQIAAATAATPEYQWFAVGTPGAGWSADPWNLLCSAEIVVSAAGQSSVADIAAAQRPAVIVHQQRPFAEQQATASALRELGLASVYDAWPDASHWPGILQQARDRAVQWEKWQVDGAAERAAQVIRDAI